MIEVEKKFSLTPEQMKRIEESAEFVKEVINTDIYFDNPDYALVKKDWWLRSRNGNFEIKIPLENKQGLINIYDEITNTKEVTKRLELKKLSEDFEENLRLNNFKVLVKLVTNRRKFRIREFNIDIDQMDCGYTICEIEKMVENENEVEKTTQEIFELAKSLGLEIKQVRGKGLEYFYRFNKGVYKVIEDTKLRYE
ncbi:MAG: CYTH domain-containing protein [Candidatus Liptonbacteria bacterium]|nr:CYTH domain-containing protein [Candidatus Liptonbacteria bacterium]